MRRLVPGLLPFLVLAGCHGPADDFSKVDVAAPALASDWAQFRNGPAGYAFQAPKDWPLDPGQEATALLSRSNVDTSPLVRVLSLPAAREHELVSFALMRFVVPSEARGELKVTDLNDLADKARKGMETNLADVRQERLTLDTGPAEHVWGTMDRVEANGTHRKMTSHVLVFTTALHTYVAMYGYPTDRETEYRPTLDRIVHSIRLFVPEKDGQVTIPESARNSPPSPPTFTTPTASTPPPVYTQAPAWGSPPPTSAPTDPNVPPHDSASSTPPAGAPPSSASGETDPPVAQGASGGQADPATQGAQGSSGGAAAPPQEPPSAGGGSAAPPAGSPPGSP